MNRCFMCEAEGKQLDQLLLDYPFARALWDLACSCFSVSWVVSDFVRNHLFAGEGFFGRKAKKKNAMFLSRAIFSNIWHERNRRVFEGVELPV